MGPTALLPPPKEGVLRNFVKYFKSKQGEDVSLFRVFHKEGSVIYVSSRIVKNDKAVSTLKVEN
jgi:hypothetical protein